MFVQMFVNARVANDVLAFGPFESRKYIHATIVMQAVIVVNLELRP